METSSGSMSYWFGGGTQMDIMKVCVQERAVGWWLGEGPKCTS